MDLIDPHGPNDHEQVVFCQDRSAGLRAIIAIHSTRLGPALGGTRFYPFPTEGEALADVLRLARAMTYKNAAAGLDFGGGKAVVIGDPHRDRTAALLRAYGRLVDSLGSRYITTEDVGTTEKDMLVVHEETTHVAGLPAELGGSGDPSPATAWGVFSAMRALARRLWGADSLRGRHVALQGVGKVGGILAGHLAQDGARLTVADLDSERAESAARSLDATLTSPEKVHAVECDIFAPCALGGALNTETIPELSCAAVCGCANNQLATPESAHLLAGNGILYAPDYIVNAGGVINIANEAGGYDRERALAQTWFIGETLERILDIAESEEITPAQAADHLAEQRLAQAAPR